MLGDAVEVAKAQYFMPCVDIVYFECEWAFFYVCCLSHCSPSFIATGLSFVGGSITIADHGSRFFVVVVETDFS